MVAMMENPLKTSIPESGISLIELLIFMVLSAMVGTAALFALSSSYQVRQQDELITSKLIDTALMKQALDQTVTMAGALVVPTTSGSTIANNVNTFFQNGFLGKTAIGSNGYLSSVAIPSSPISITASTVSIYWISDNQGGQELCQGTLSLVGDTMRYIVNSVNYSGTSSTCTPTGSRSAEADFLVGTGWSFQPTIQKTTNCLGPAFNGRQTEALVAVKAPMAGSSSESNTAPTQISVCLPN